ncbi:MAG: FtsX-like permease family protein [Bacteroidales bacterium]|nr:FtsX-like permease family protein [Bacteroidales bacterium]
MALHYLIAKRYLFARKSHHAINVISWISVCGVAVATMAMVCTLSVFNGFQELFSTLFCNFDPQIEITSRQGKVFDPTSKEFDAIRKMKEVAIFTEVLEENALLKYQDRQVPATIKGVADNFEQLTSIDSIIVNGHFMLYDSLVDYGTLGVGLANVLGTGSSFVDPLEVFAPKRGVRINMTNPAASCTQDYLFVSAIFSLEQPEYDEKYVIVPLHFARRLFDYEKEVSSIELKLAENSSVLEIKHKIEQALGEDYFVKDQYEQQEDFYKMMNLEKWISFLILSFIMLIATFNIIGSLSMLIFDKKDDIITLRNLGANDTFITRIFLIEGSLISLGGVLSGILLGVILTLTQQYFGILRLGESNTFIVDSYPVRLDMTDLILVFITVLIIGFFAVWFPVRYLGKRWLKSL